MPTPAIISATPPQRHRFHFLDALRGIAAIVVADFHSAPLVGNTILAFSYERRLFEGLKVGSFFAARIIRLYPMVFFAMTIGIVKPLLRLLHRSDYPFLRAKAAAYLHGIFLLPNITLHRPLLVFPLDNPAWSLFFELIANLIFGILAFRRKTPTWLLSLVFAASLCLLAAGARAQVSFNAMGAESDLIPFLLGLPRVALSFTSGVIVFRLYHRWRDAARLRNFGVGAALLVLTLLLLVLLSPFSWMQTAPFRLLSIRHALPRVPGSHRAPSRQPPSARFHARRTVVPAVSAPRCSEHRFRQRRSDTARALASAASNYSFAHHLSRHTHRLRFR